MAVASSAAARPRARPALVPGVFLGKPVELVRGGDERCGYEVATPPVPTHLRPFFSSWVGYREWSRAPLLRLEYPSGRAVLILEVGAPVGVREAASDGELQRFRSGFFAGIDDAASLTAFTGEQAGVQLDLTPRGALAFAGRPLHEVARQVVPVADLGLDGVSALLVEQLAEAPSWGERFALVARALERRCGAAPAPSETVTWSVARIDAAGGDVRIEALAAELGYSRKHLHERFLREVGLSPKRYAEVRRFDRVVKRLRAGDRGNLAGLAAELGYSDQAHLSREVRRFSSLSASALAVALEDPMGQALAQLRQ